MSDSSSIQRPPHLTVSQLTNAIKLSLESTFSFVYLQGEISNFKVQSSGHLYFSLKDAQAQIAAVMFKAEASSLKLLPKAGDHVMVKGELNVYPPKGNYQLIVRELSYVGLGELLQKLELLKIKLHQQGWFKAARKKPIPRFPQRIGVVTSPTGAVIQDILNVLSRRFSGFHLILNPVKVQGEGAAQEIAQAITQFNQHRLVDVMIVGRGGGSLEDLWAFNEESVAEAIYHSQIPVISAVGHETDHCIADYVADVRAPTPSAAAEIVIAEKSQQLAYLSTIRKRMQQTIGHFIQQNHYRLERITKHPLITHPYAMIEWRMQKLDDYRLDLDQQLRQFLQLKRHQWEARAHQVAALNPTTQIAHSRQHLSYKTQQLQHLWQTKQTQRRHMFHLERFQLSLQQTMNNRLTVNRQRLTHLIDLLRVLDPRNVLQKGYSILFAEKEASIINSARQLHQGQQVKVLLVDGEALMTINEVIVRECD
jgi:exodeoxyribonuclease VII large subunit